MSTLYLALPAEGSELPRPCVLKFPHASLWTREGSEARIQEELAKLSQVTASSASLVRMDSRLHQDPVLGSFFVMEHLNGRNLRAWLTENPTPTPKQVFSLIFQICQALEALHQGGCVHRDLQPENIFVMAPETETPTIKVLDFGLAKPNAGSEGGDFTQGVVGSPYYLSPEQCLNQQVAPRSDLYALGVILYELLTERWPFGEKPEDVASSLFTTLHAHVSLPPEPLCMVRHDLGYSEELERVVMKLLAKAPEDRYARASDLWSALSNIPIFEGEAITPAQLLRESEPIRQAEIEAPSIMEDAVAEPQLVVEPEPPPFVHVRRYTSSQRPRWISGWLLLWLGTCAGASMWSLAPEGQAWWAAQLHHVKRSLSWEVPSDSSLWKPSPKAFATHSHGQRPDARKHPFAVARTTAGHPRSPSHPPSFPTHKHLAQSQAPIVASNTRRIVRRSRAFRKRRARPAASASLERPKPTTQQAEPASRPRPLQPPTHETKTPGSQHTPTEDALRFVRKQQNAPVEPRDNAPKEVVPTRLVPVPAQPSRMVVLREPHRSPSLSKENETPHPPLVVPSPRPVKVVVRPLPSIAPTTQLPTPLIAKQGAVKPNTSCGDSQTPCKGTKALPSKTSISSSKKVDTPADKETSLPTKRNANTPPQTTPPTNTEKQQPSPVLAVAPVLRDTQRAPSPPTAAEQHNTTEPSTPPRSKQPMDRDVAPAQGTVHPSNNHPSATNPAPKRPTALAVAQKTMSSRPPVLGLSVLAGMRILPLVPQQLVRLIFPSKKSPTSSTKKPEASNPSADPSPSLAVAPMVRANHPTKPPTHTPCSASTENSAALCLPTQAAKIVGKGTDAVTPPEERTPAMGLLLTPPLGGALEAPHRKVNRTNERFHAQHRLFEAFLFPQQTQDTSAPTKKREIPRYFLPFSQRWVDLTQIPPLPSDTSPSTDTPQRKTPTDTLLRLESCAARMFLLLRSEHQNEALNAAVSCVLAQKSQRVLADDTKKGRIVREILASAFYLQSLQSMRQILEFAWEENFDKEPLQSLEDLLRLSREAIASLQQITPLQQPLWSSCARFREAQTKAWLSWRIRGFLDSTLFGHRLTAAHRKQLVAMDARLRQKARLLFRDAVRADLDAGVEHVCAQRSLLGLHLLREPTNILPKTPR